MDSNPVSLIENPTLHQYFRVNKLYENGLREKIGKVSDMLARQQVVKQFQDLDEFIADETSTCLVRGSPDMGKSCNTWAWACKKGINDGKPVLWIRLRKVGKYSCVSMREKTCSECDLESDLIHSVLENSDAEIIMVDVLHADLISTKPNDGPNLLGKIFSRV
jgi:hypothetical protein